MTVIKIDVITRPHSSHVGRYVLREHYPSFVHGPLVSTRPRETILFYPFKQLRCSPRAPLLSYAPANVLTLLLERS